MRPSDRFAPHVTLLYGFPPMPPQPIEPIRFTVADFALIHSKLGLTQYEIIDRWPLAGRASEPSRDQP